jgi:hypothetical protein
MTCSLPVLVRPFPKHRTVRRGSTSSLPGV